MADPAEAWVKWKRRFTFYVDSLAAVTDARKYAKLFYVGGKKLQEVYETLGDNDHTFTAAITALDAHFIPKKNVLFQRHEMRQIRQSKGETVDQWVVRLRTAVRHCSYADRNEENAAILEQLIDQCTSAKLRRRKMGPYAFV